MTTHKAKKAPLLFRCVFNAINISTKKFLSNHLPRKQLYAITKMLCRLVYGETSRQLSHHRKRPS